MLKQWIEAGKIVSVHGVRGEAKAEAWCDDPEFLCRLPALRVGTPETALPVERARVHKGMLLIKFLGIHTPEAAAELRGKLLYVAREEIPMTEGEYLILDLIGCAVFDVDTGECYGKLCDVSKTGANDVWHIRFADQTVRLVPVIPQVVLSVDLEGRKILIRPLEGLFDG